MVRNYNLKINPNSKLSDEERQKLTELVKSHNAEQAKQRVKKYSFTMSFAEMEEKRSYKYFKELVESFPDEQPLEQAAHYFLAIIERKIKNDKKETKRRTAIGKSRNEQLRNTKIIVANCLNVLTQNRRKPKPKGAGKLISELLGVSESTVSRAIRSVEKNRIKRK